MTMTPTEPEPPQQPPPAGCNCTKEQRATFVGWVGQLVHEHRLLLANVARREGLGPEDAFDVVQEAFHTFLTLPQARALVDARDDARNLLVAVTRNLARNRRRLAALARPHERDERALDALPAPSPSVEDLLAAAEEELRLHGCVQELGDVQRTVVTLRMLDELPGDDVARELGISPGHVAVLLHRAKAKLLSCMTAPAKPPAR